MFIFSIAFFAAHNALLIKLSFRINGIRQNWLLVFKRTAHQFIWCRTSTLTRFAASKTAAI
jgi:hypothetical protein